MNTTTNRSTGRGKPINKAANRAMSKKYAARKVGRSKSLNRPETPNLNAEVRPSMPSRYYRNTNAPYTANVWDMVVGTPSKNNIPRRVNKENTRVIPPKTPVQFTYLPRGPKTDALITRLARSAGTVCRGHIKRTYHNHVLGPNETGRRFLVIAHIPTPKSSVPVGFAECEMQSDKTSERILHIHLICTSTRGIGVGKRLIAAVESLARMHLGARVVQLDAVLAQVAWYKSLGFKRTPNACAQNAYGFYNPLNVFRRSPNGKHFVYNGKEISRSYMRALEGRFYQHRDDPEDTVVMSKCLANVNTSAAQLFNGQRFTNMTSRNVTNLAGGAYLPPKPKRTRNNNQPGAKRVLRIRLKAPKI